MAFKICFFGTPPYAVPTLEALVEAGHDVVRVIAQPDRPAGRGRKLVSPAVAVRARELGLDCRQPKGIRTGPFPRNFKALDVDVGIVVAYGRILTAELLSHPPRGMINGHGSLLPRWRGSAPIERGLMAGDTEAGVTTMLMDEGLDTGDMLLRRGLPITDADDAGTLRARLSRLTAEMIVETLASLDDLTPRAQPAEGVCHAPPLTRDDAVLDWSQTARESFNRVRAFSLRRGGVTTFRDQPFKIRVARPAGSEHGAGKPGTVLVAGKSLVIACGEGALEVVEGQLPGKRAVGGRDLVNGARIQVGEIFQ